MTRFEVGKGYWATESATDRRVVVVALGTVEGVPMFAKIKDFGDVKQVYRLEGREFAQIAFKDGLYTASSAVPVDVCDAKFVLDAVTKG